VKKLLITLLVIILAVSMMTACGGGKGGAGDSAGGAAQADSAAPADNAAPESGDGKDSGESAKPTADIIKPSELLTIEDAEKITGKKMEVYTLDEISTGAEEGTIQTTYVSDDEGNLALNIQLVQEGLIKSESLIELGGIAFKMKRLKMYAENNDAAVPLDGFGDWAYITDMMGTSFKVATGDYYLSVSAGIKDMMHPIPKDEEEALKQLFHDAALEGGELAYERLTAIIK